MSPLRRLVALAWTHRRGAFVSVLVLMAVGGLGEFAMIAALLPFLALLTGSPGAEGFAATAIGYGIAPLTAAAILFALAAIGTGILRLLLSWRTQHFVFDLGSDIAIDIQRRLLAQPYAYHVAHNSSEILASLEKINMLVFVLLQAMQAASAALMAGFVVVALLLVDPGVALACGLAVGGLYLLVSATIRRRLDRNSGTSGAAYGQRVKILQESLGGIRDVIVDGSQRTHVEAFAVIDRRLAQARAGTAVAAAAPRFVVEAIGMALIAGLAVWLAAEDGGAAALPVLGAFVLGSQRLLPLAQQLFNGLANVRGNRAIAADVLALAELPVDEHADDGAPPLPFAQAIRLDGVGVHYPGRGAPALADISLAVPHGSTFGLIGETGSGKSTLLDLLMGLIEPGEGTVAIDGAPLTAANRRGWWQNIAHVPQAIFLADASIARNIAIGAGDAAVDHARVEAAARRALLHDFILSLPDGYETRVGENGVRLSGGQRQRLGIARALHKRATVIILDEATSALDEATERAVLDGIHAGGGDGAPVTILMVTHRIASLRHCDQIARLADGRLVAVGTLAEVAEADA